MRLRFVRRSSSVVGLLIVLSLFPAMGNPPAVAHQAQAVSASSSHGSSVMFIENVGQFAAGAPEAEIAAVLTSAAQVTAGNDPPVRSQTLVGSNARGTAPTSLTRPATQQCTTWNLASDFRLYPNQENPNRDACSSPDIWHYMQGSGLSRDPTTYSLMTRFMPNGAGRWGLEEWMGDIHNPYEPDNYVPSVAINATGTTQIVSGVPWPSGVLAVHPGPAQLAVVGWQSPVDATVSVTGTIRDRDPNCGDGVLWYIDKGSSSLASGSLANGGGQDVRNGTGGGSLANIIVSQGEFLYFVVHPRGNWNCDSTQLDVSIAITGSYSVSGRIAGASDNSVAGATVSVGAAGSATTDDNGNYTLSGLVAGTYTLTPTKSGYTFSPASRTITVPPDATGQDFVGQASVTSLVYTGAQFLTPAEVIDEVDARISTGDHVHLNLPFTNNGNTPIANAIIEVLGAPHSGTTAGTEIYDGSAWRINPESTSLSLGTINPGETRWLDFWIYVIDSDPTLRQSLSGQTWIDVQSLTGSWRIGINLSPISFSGTVIGNDDMEAGSCLHTPQNPSIQQYAQYAAGACVKNDRTSISEVCKPRTPPSQAGDPDAPAQAVRNLVDRVNAEFKYKSDRYSRRTIDVRLLQNRGGDIGVCRDYADLTTGLLRSLNLPARTITAYLKYDKAYEQQTGEKGGAGHAWSETFLSSSETPAWKQADSTWNKAIDQQSAYEDDSRFSKVQEAWADKNPLSSASPWVGKEYRCIAPCYQTPVDCAKCQQESNTDKWWPFLPDLSCVENVQSVYHSAGIAAAYTPWTTGELLVNLEGPTSVTHSVPFVISTGVTNDTLSELDIITATIALREYVDSTEQLFEVTPSYQVLNNVGAGETITVTWTITPLVAGSGIPLRFSAESGDLFEFTERPLVVNEPGTLPDLSLAGVCGLDNASPGQEVTLTASVLDEDLQVFSDPATVVTATVIATPTLQFSTALTLPYCGSCEAYQGAFTLPDTAPIGDYVVNFEAAHPSYDPAHTTSGFFVIPPLTVSLSTDQSTVGVLDMITLTTQVFDRGAAVSEAAVAAGIITPEGTVTVPLTFDSISGTYKLALHPADLAGNLGGEVHAGTWQVQASANFQGGAGSGDTSFTVVGTYPLSEVVITKSEVGATLTWPHMGSGVDHYRVYRSGSPYFTPGGAESVKLSPDVAPAPTAGDELSFADADAFAEPGMSYFYIVQPIDANGQFYLKSNRVGVFNFALVPGSP